MKMYLDYAATSPLENKVSLHSMIDNESFFGNPSSNHECGFQTACNLRAARNIIAEVLKCYPEEIIFTSGGTESDNMAIKGIMFKYKPEEAEMITSTIEHPAILETCKQLERMGYTVKYVKPKFNNKVNVDDIKSLITDKTKLVSIMAMNNETGIVNPIELISRICRGKGIVFHTDYVQASTKIPFPEIDLPDIASFSGHKFGSLKGVGFLFKKRHIKLEPLLCGGGQEFGLRSGTENVFAIYHMAICFQDYSKKWEEKGQYIRNIIEAFSRELANLFGDNVMFISDAIESHGILSIAFKNIDSDTLQLLLSNKGYMVSVGSACHSNINGISHVIKEIEIPEEFQNGVIRISFPPELDLKDFAKFKEELIFNARHLLERN